MPPWVPVGHSARSPMPPTPAPEASGCRQTGDSSSRLQEQLTPPPSLPTSPPTSPDANKYKEGAAIGSSPHAGVEQGGRRSEGLPRRREGKAGGKSGRTVQVEVEAVELPERYRTKSEKILPRVKVAFPSSMLLSEEDYCAPSQASSSATFGRKEGRRVVSQTTTSTTVRRTEKRHVRYSLPSFDDAFDEGPPSTPLSSSRSYRHTATSPPSTVPARSQSRTRSPSGVQTRRSSGSHSRAPRSTHQPRRTSSLHEASAPAGKSGRPSRAAGPASSSPFFSRSYGGGSGHALQRRNSSEAEDANDVAAFAATLTETTMPFVRPVVSAFAFLAVSAIAALTVSAVLLTSFSLTFYDDCAQRLGHVQRSLGGVRAGMGRLIGNARGALDLAVRATAGPVSPSTAASSAADAKRAESGRTAMPAVQDDDSVTAGDEQGQETSGAEGGPDPVRSRGGSSSAAPGRAYPTPFLSPLRRFTSTFPNPSPSQGEPVDAGGWGTDEDALPYDVPHPTPHVSRPPSPHRGRAPRSRTSTGSSSASSTGSALPPRPPLAVLIPSVIFALLFTLAKLLAGAIKGKKPAPARRA